MTFKIFNLLLIRESLYTQYFNILLCAKVYAREKYLKPLIR